MNLNDGLHAAVPNGAPVPIHSAAWFQGCGIIGLIGR